MGGVGVVSNPIYTFFYKNEVYKKDRLEIPKIQENSKNVAMLTKFHILIREKCIVKPSFNWKEDED